jgi:hypothetical protein
MILQAQDHFWVSFSNIYLIIMLTNLIYSDNTVKAIPVLAGSPQKSSATQTQIQQ